MASLIQGAKDLLGKVRGKASDRHAHTAFSSMSHDDKLGYLYRVYRCEDPNGRLLLNRTWFRTALYYQGKQQVQWNDETGSLDFFDPLPGEDWYAENQFRKDVQSNVAMLCKSEVEPSAAPNSDQPADVAAAKVAEYALEMIHDDTDYDRGVMLKNLNLCLFGNSFKYQTFVRDGQAHGTTIIPNYKYEDTTLPGVSACPQCGNTAETPASGPASCPGCSTPMESLSEPQTIPSKVEDGFTETENGRVTEIITGPLEMYMRSKVLHGLKYQPYLFWVRRIDCDIVKDARPQVELNIDSRVGADEDLAQYYIDVLSSLAGGPYEGVYKTSGSRSYRECEYAMCWIRPEAFQGDEELNRIYPMGVMFETCNGKYIKDTAVSQSMDDSWTHYVYLVNPYSAWGEGMVDALPVQDQINEINSLMVRYIRYCTIGKVLYDQEMIDPEWLSNNPDEAWVKTSRQLEKKLSDSVYQMNPTQMSQNVPLWKQELYGTMQDMTHAYNAVQGKSSGANTPYSSDVFQAEQAMGWFLPMFKYNRASTIQCCRQQLKLFRDNGDEERTRKFKDNTGKWSFAQFMGSDLSQGSYDIFISETEAAPKSKAEKAHGLELYATLAPLMPTLSQKQRVYVLDLIGMPPDANPDTLISQKAYRDIEAIVKRGQNVVPNGFILDIPVYVKTIKEYLAGEEGDDLAATQGPLFVKVFNLMITALMQGQMQTAAMPPHGPGQPVPPGQPQPMPGGNVPQGTPPNQGTPAKQPKQEFAQSPVPPPQRQPMPPLPAGARQQ